MGRGQQSAQEHVADKFSSVFGDRRGANRDEETVAPTTLDVGGCRLVVLPPRADGASDNLISKLAMVSIRDGKKVGKSHELKVSGDECTFGPQLLLDLQSLGLSDEQQKSVFEWLDAQEFSRLGLPRW